MDEELRNLQLDRLDQRGKTTEQLRRHTLDTIIENKPVEKALYLLVKGDEVQKISVVQSLPTLLSQDPNSTLTKVIPKIQQELFHSSSEFQVTTSHVFQVLISNHLYASDGTITATLLQSLESKDPVVANAWLDTLLEVILILPLKTIQTEIIPLAVYKGQCSQPMTSRIASCRIIGKIANHPFMKPIEIKKDVLPLVHGLCQDINYNVRAAICEQIPAIVQGLGCNLSRINLLPNLVELSQDDNQNVRAIAVSSVINCLPFLDKDTKVSTMSPLLMQLCTTSMKEESYASLTLAKDMGILLNCINGCVTQAETEILINYYLELARRGFDIRKYNYQNADSSQDVLCRQYCASNLPAVSMFIVNNSQTQCDKLYDVFKSLSSDSCYLVRQTVGGIFHEVARILGKQNIILKPDFVRLLRDDAEEVLSMLVPYLSRSFELFVISGLLAVDRITPASVEVSKALIKCLTQLRKGYNWRLLATFLKQLEYLPKCFRADQIHNDFTPAIVQCAVKSGTKPVRVQATRTLLVFLRWNTRQVQRTWLREHLISELAESNSCYTRHIFIQLCINAVELFSFKYFKENFFFPLLSLSEDNVSTVRYSMVSLLPTLRKMIRLPADRRLLQSLESVIMQLEKNEKDRDVLTNLIKRSKEMMTPVQLGPTQTDTDNNQRRLIEEEELIVKGKLVFQRVKVEHTKSHTGVRKDVSSLERTRSAKAMNRSLSVNRQASSRSALNSVSATSRSTSVPRSGRNSRTLPQVGSTREIISDMTFLNQHFYTDAGIHLPIKDIDTVQSEELTTVPEDTDESTLHLNKPGAVINVEKIGNLYQGESASLSTLNITDDIKVNLRNLSRKNINKNKRLSQSEIPTPVSSELTKNKRYSSIHSEAEISGKKTAINKRRSLLVNPKDISKIPIILKPGDVLDDKKGSNSNDKTEEKSIKKISNLPVPLRRKQM